MGARRNVLYISFFVGGMFGVVLMCIFQISGQNSDAERRYLQMKREEEPSDAE